MKTILTVIIPCHNDSAELVETIRSIRATAGSNVEIVVIDDASAKAVFVANEKVYRTERRIGVGPARHLGALRANTDFLLFIDSHCRFQPGWYETARERIAFRPTTVHCGVCLGLGPTNHGTVNMDMDNPNARYYGATWNLVGPDKKFPKATQVFENVWWQEQDGDDYDIPAVMGACYFVPRDWYLKLHCGEFLNSYGADEQELSLKTWLAGGNCRMLKGVKIGHKFKPDPIAKRGKYGQASASPAPYNATHHVTRNKLFLILTCLPQYSANILIAHLRQRPDFSTAYKTLMADWRVVEIERAYNQRLFTRDFNWLVSTFGLNMPVK